MKKPVKIALIILAVLLAAAAAVWAVTRSPQTPAEQHAELTGGAPAGTRPPGESFFEAHFINVGEADAALVICDGHAMLIDGGNSSDSRRVYSYIKNHFVEHLDYVVGTHSDEDHIGGIPGALVWASAGKVYCSSDKGGTKAFENFVKYVKKRGLSITVPKAGERFYLGSAEVSVLGPIAFSNDPNNDSIVLRIVYGKTSFLFTGDMEREEEQDILASGAELKSTVLKVAHHGSNSSTSYPFLREVMPEYAVISVGENQYGHPSEQVLSRLRDAGARVLRTDMQGHIVLRSDGRRVTAEVQRNEGADTLAVNTPAPTAPPKTSPTESEAGEGNYVLNVKTGKFHYPSCPSAAEISEANRREFSGSREELIGMGYEPCKRCRP